MYVLRNSVYTEPCHLHLENKPSQGLHDVRPIEGPGGGDAQFWGWRHVRHDELSVNHKTYPDRLRNVSSLPLTIHKTLAFCLPRKE
jgi:hypothetical protein